MRTINITFDLTERQYEYLRLAQMDRPNPQRIKLMLLSQAASTLRRMGEEVMNEARQQDRPAAKPYQTLADIERENKKKLADINKAAAERAAKGLYRTKPSNKKKPNPSDYSAVKVDPKIN